MALDILIAGKYRLGRKLGGGSFGEIFLGPLNCCERAWRAYSAIVACSSVAEIAQRRCAVSKMHLINPYDCIHCASRHQPADRRGGRH
jgi:hypothetical protein